jgi:hypothetical protein
MSVPALAATPVLIDGTGARTLDAELLERTNLIADHEDDLGIRGAACRNRTDDLFITSEPLCRLS